MAVDITAPIRIDLTAGTDQADMGTDYDSGNSWHVALGKLQWGASGTFNYVDASSGKGLPIQGETAHDAAATGNPVRIGAKYVASPSTVVTGDAVDLLATARGELKVLNVDSAGNAIDPANSDVFTARQVNLTFTSDTTANVSGELIADRQPIVGAAPATDTACVLASVTVINNDATSPAALDLRLHFAKADFTMGTEGGAFSISAANAVNHQGYVDIAAADWVDVGGAQVATINNINLGLQPASGGSSVYVGLQAQGAVDIDAADDISAFFTFL